MTQTYAYKVVDVFTSQPLLGNPVAVVLDAEGLSTEQMRAVANWTNLSETTFVLPPSTPKADYRLRIFTPRSELPFAGHPTLGSAHAMLEAGLAQPGPGGKMVQECQMGNVEITVDESTQDRRLTFSLPAAEIQDLNPVDVSELEDVVKHRFDGGAAPAIVNVGPLWVVARLKNAESVLGLRPDFGRLADFERRLGVTGLTVFGGRSRSDEAIEVRSFAPSCGVDEDPVCGSGNGAVAVFQWERHLLPPVGASYLASQGRLVGRNGRVHVSVDTSGAVHVGGTCVTGISGTLTL